MGLGQAVRVIADTFDGIAYFLTFLCGLLTIMVERYLYRRRNYAREARITAIVGWSYVVGGSLLYLLVATLQAWL
ncbi:MAG TPA: CLC_0170 family protein [Symbiobacteriaceae bacterium]|nr:CLC_0170 family protein [Symbiobacteriaceae bacterium]